MPNGTYDPNQSTPKDRARFLLGDTAVDTPGVWLLDDLEYGAMLGGPFTFSEAVAQMARGLLSRFGQMPTWFEDAGGTRLKWENLRAGWQGLIDELRSGDARDEVSYEGGTYVAAPCPQRPRNQPGSNPCMGFRF